MLPLAERKVVVSAVRNLCKSPQGGIDIDGVKKLALILGSHQECLNLYDEFGLFRIGSIEETISVVNNEFGIDGDVVVAFILSDLLEDIEPKYIMDAGLSQSVIRFFTVFRNVRSLLDAKTSSLQSEHFRNLFVSIAEDMRVILLLIVHCLTVMRKIKDVDDKVSQRHLATEASLLYAPLAHKLGLYKIKSELEDLSLKYLEHDAYYLIKDALNATKKSRDAYIERFIAPIKEMLLNEGYKFQIKGRTKSIHSIWQKMQKQKCDFTGVYDLFAIRIILDVAPEHELEQCWKVFSLITDRYDSNLKRLRDWLTVPKSNGYKSLHITVLGPENKWVEVQIRTKQMDEVAEHGLAAHWRYKGVRSSDGGVDQWLADIRSALEYRNEELLSEKLSDKDLKQEVYVFTPKGDLYKLPHNATVLDFAYAIHTGIGNKCVGAKVNGKNVPMRHVLRSGTTVEIITSSSQEPKLEWLNFVVSSHARAKIKGAVRDLQTKDGGMGRELLERKLKNRKIEWDENIVNQLIKKYGYKEYVAFYKDLAEDKLDFNALLEVYQKLQKYEAGIAERVVARSAEEYNYEQQYEERGKLSSDVLLIDKNVKGLDFQMARCCNPVYGDDVFGFVTVSGGIKIHRVSCPNAVALHERFPYRIVPAKWAGKGIGKYTIVLYVVGQDDLGVVNNITSIISKEEQTTLRGIKIDSHDGLFYGTFTVILEDVQKLNSLIKKVKAIKGVKGVSRS